LIQETTTFRRFETLWRTVKQQARTYGVKSASRQHPAFVVCHYVVMHQDAGAAEELRGPVLSGLRQSVRLLYLKFLPRCTPKTRVRLCLIGGGMALIAVSLPGFYSVSAPLGADIGNGVSIIDQINNGPTGTGRLASVIGANFSAWNGPVDSRYLLGSIFSALLIGISTYIGASGKGLFIRWNWLIHLRRIIRYSSLFIVVPYLYQFRVGNIPPEVTRAFIAVAGAGPKALSYANDITFSLGGYNVIFLVVGWLLYTFGVLAADTRKNVLADLRLRVQELEISIARDEAKASKPRRSSSRPRP
jgi:hypothetical protein